MVYIFFYINFAANLNLILFTMKKYIKYSVGAIFCAMILSLHFYNAFFTGYGVLTNESLHVSITAQTNGGECSNCTNGSCGQCPPPACSNCSNGTCGECHTSYFGMMPCSMCTNEDCDCDCPTKEIKAKNQSGWQTFWTKVGQTIESIWSCIVDFFSGHSVEWFFEDGRFGIRVNLNFP